MEGTMEWYKGLFQQIINDGLKNKINQRDCLDLLLNMREDFAFSENKEVRDYAMKISKYAHEMAAYMAAQTGSGEFDDLYWKYLLLEAPEVLDSYCLYIEKDRKPKERFYQPRRKTLIKVVNLLQRLENDELDEAFIHMPARVGKAEPLDALVLTPDGFKKMKDIHAGSKVISGTGKICNVTDVFPQGKKDVYRVTFSDGTSAECCKEHLWKVQTPDDRRTDRRKGKQAYRVIELQEMFGMDETSATELAGLTGEIAEPDKFFSALDKFVKATIKKAGEDSVEALIKSNPSIKAGNGDGGGESLAVRKAKELSRGNRTVNQDILKNYM